MYTIFVKQEKLRGQLRENISLADYTAWRVGGLAQRLYEPADLEDLIYFLQTLPVEEPLTWLGLGSNTLIRDGGVSGTVIITQGHLNQLIVDGVNVRAEAGVACPALARFCARANLEGLEFLAGIPGTVGGALAMNAGCHGGETWQYVTAVETITHRGECKLRTPSDYKITYRNVSGVTNEWFIAGHFRLREGNKEKSLEIIRQLLARRVATQPINEPNCGSVFRNPPDDYAARLIESCGLKGKQIGGAIVSSKHANFIVNDGTATAEDIENLIKWVEANVEQSYGIKLVREVHIIGLAK